ncbi:Glycerol kinase [Planctomycetales bacterium 10988]|nr:Glycerol kinase [Planctomycetales bacterium 10988]
MDYILSLDQGTTSSRAILFNRSGQAVAMAQKEFRQILPKPGHVEHDPEEIWETQLEVARKAIEKAEIQPEQIAAIGITNQRETTILWEKATGKPIANAIVWQSRISAPYCKKLIEEGLEETIRSKTGLVIDAYFSATKIQFLFDQHDGLRERAERGEILFGTVDSFLMWKLSGGKCHATDVSNASRTMLFNLNTLKWDEELLKLLNIPSVMLPEVRDSSGIFTTTDPQWFGKEIPISGVAGDQQAATFGQACFQKGEAKNTYGTGCFLLMNIGSEPVISENRLLTTVGWRIGKETVYCLEGAVFIAGAVVQWLRDGLKIINSSEEIEALAQSVEDSDGVYLVPAFVGLGAPYWDSTATGTILGLSRGTSAGHLARAALESMAFQTKDVLDAMQEDAQIPLKRLKVDGGASVNSLLMQFQADLLQTRIERPQVPETTALGAAYLAGLAVGYWNDLSEIEENWQLDQAYYFEENSQEMQRRYRQWQRAVKRSQHWLEDNSESEM